MPLSPPHFSLLPLTSIWISRDLRQRKKVEVRDLLTSIARRGVLNPILVVNEVGPEGQPWKLIAGERRLEASRFLELLEIPARFFSDLSPLELQIVELEENTKRQDLTWQEIVETTEKIHRLYLRLAEEEGKGWTQSATADALGLTEGELSLYLRVAGEMGREIVRTAGGVREAYNHIARKDQRAQGVALQELIDIATKPLGASSPSGQVRGMLFLPGDTVSVGGIQADPAPSLPPPSILNLDFISWSRGYIGPKFNFIHCDFPYGIEIFSGPQGREGGNLQAGSVPAYGDSPDVFFTLLEALCASFNNFAAYSCHIMFWYSEKNGPKMREILKEKLPGMTWQIHPLIWIKTDNMGISPDPKRLPRHIYETALVGSRGLRNIVQTIGDAYACPTDKVLHASAKPEPMLRHFFRMFVDEGTEVLDPTCGSASALRAAESLGASRVLGLESDPHHFATATRALASFRALNSASLTKQRKELHDKAEANVEVTSRLGLGGEAAGTDDGGMVGGEESGEDGRVCG